jgi:hypothetical protein
VYARKGLFPGVYGNVSIKNITISDAYLNSTSSESATNRSRYVGALVGMSYHTITKIKFENCYVADSVHLEALHTTAGFVGGGACSSISFVSCASFAHVTNRHSTTVRYGSFIGNFDGGDRKITYNNCIGSLVYTSYFQYPTYTASYCAVNGTADSGSNKTYPTVVSLDNMKGEAAKTNMPDLDWTIWHTTEKYPELALKKIVWDGTIATEYAGGTGTEEDPYLIETPQQLALMAIGTDYGEKGANIVGKYYKLTADIYLNDTDNPNKSAVFHHGIQTYLFCNIHRLRCHGGNK